MTRPRSALLAGLLALLALAAGCQAPAGPGGDDATPSPTGDSASPSSPGEMDAGGDDYGQSDY